MSAALHPLRQHCQAPKATRATGLTQLTWQMAGKRSLSNRATHCTALLAQRPWRTALPPSRGGHACAGPGLPWQFPAEVSQRREARLKTAITVSGLGVAVLAAGIWLWAAHGVSQQDELRDALRQDHLNAWMLAVRSLEPPPYPKALADLQKAIAQASQQNGVLVKFEHQQGRSGWTLNVNDQLVTGASN